MDLHAQERLWWSPTLTAVDSHGNPVTVAVTGWEASFDGGTTWQPSRDDAGRPGWLIAGANFPGPGDTAGAVTTDAVINHSVGVLIRLRDTPETVIDSTLRITYC